MQAFFAGVGDGPSAGVWGDVPRDRPEFKEAYRRRLAKQAKAAKAEEMV
jgi:chlorophyllide a reductase subunit Y